MESAADSRGACACVAHQENFNDDAMGRVAVPQDCPYPSCQMEFLGRIRHAKHEWESTVDAVPEIILLLDGNGHIVRANRAVEGWGLGRVLEIKGREMHALLHPGCIDADCYLDAFWGHSRTVLAQGKPAECEAEDQYLRRYIHLELRPNEAMKVSENSVSASFAVAILHDVSKLKRAEHALKSFNEALEARVKSRTLELWQTNESLRREINQRALAEKALLDSQSQYRLLVETMNEGLAVQDANGVLIYVNQWLGQMLGYERCEMEGRHCTEYVAEDSLDTWREHAALRQRGEHASYEIALKAKGGRKVFAKISPKVLFQEDGSYGGSFAIVTDLTERIEAELELRESESALRLLSAQLMTAQEQERKRIASELHDGIGQTLSAVKFTVEDALRMWSECSMQNGIAQLERLVPMMQAAIEEVRRISMNLRPSTLDDLGILATLAWFFRQFESIYGDVHVIKRISIQESDVPVPLKTTIYRILQEAMNNVAIHGKASTVYVTLQSRNEMIELSIRDDGQGFELEEVFANTGSHRGFGLASMRERAESAGGRCSIISRIGNGTCVSASWPNCGLHAKPVTSQPAAPFTL